MPAGGRITPISGALSWMGSEGTKLANSFLSDQGVSVFLGLFWPERPDEKTWTDGSKRLKGRVSVCDHDGILLSLDKI